MRRSAQAATPLAPDDAARLHMSIESNPMLITVLLALDRPIAARELEARLAERLLRHARFRRRVEEPLLGLGMPRWSDDPAFDVRNHVHRIDPAVFPSDRRPSLQEIVSDVASVPLAREHPLWRAHVIDGPEPGVVMVVHHALADGAALLALLAELADQPEATVVEPEPSTRTRIARLTRLTQAAFAARRLAMSPRDPTTPLKRPRLVGRRHLAFSRALSVERLREEAHANETTMTGLLLAAVAGACRAEIHPSAGDETLTLHALLPVDARPRGSRPEERVTLGNSFGSVLVPLPVGLRDRAERARFVAREMRRIRSGATGAGAARMAAAAGVLSSFVERLGVAIFSRKASVVVSSVRGPDHHLRLCGARIDDVIVWAPATGSIGVSITLMSYAGHARVGIAVDEGISDDPRRLLRVIEEELDPL